MKHITPIYSIIIPTPKFGDRLLVLESLSELDLDQNLYETFVVQGGNPPAQRNDAIRKAKGEIIIFFDSDCMVPQEFFEKLGIWRERVEAVVGGPILLPQSHSDREALSQAIFSNPFITGPSAARYSARGAFRESCERELILCNLVVRKELFEQYGLFNEGLFPGEENEWLDRVLKDRVAVFYDPGLFVFRPQRKSWSSLFHTFFRYGTGRGKLCTLTGRVDILRCMPLFAAVSFILSLLLFPVGKVLNISLSLLAAYVLIVTCSLQGVSFLERVIVGLSAPILVGCYSVGQLWGALKIVAATLGRRQTPPLQTGSGVVGASVLSNFGLVSLSHTLACVKCVENNPPAP